MKKIKCCYYVLFLALVAISITSCNSDELQSSEEFDVSFTISNVTNNPSSVSSNSGMSKVNVIDTIIKCSQSKADYVKYKIGDGDFKKIPVFYIAGRAWTNNIRLKAGTYVLSEFLVYSDRNTPDDETDDILLSATPHKNAVFAIYVQKPLNHEFTVTVDKKNEIILEVVCFEPKSFECFGFTYFKLNEIKIRQLWFFSNFCIKNKADYDGSLYAQQSGWNSVLGPFIDVPAILKVEVWRNDKLENTFTNSPQGEKLTVNYADNLAQTDKIEIKLFILVRQGTTFNYVHFKTWKFNDISDIPDRENDGVIDGVLGNCYDPGNPPDFIIEPCYNYVNETAWSYGPRYEETGNWATYTPYNGVEKTVNLFAGQTLLAGTVKFSAPVSGKVTITIMLDSDWSLQNVSEPVKIQGYRTAPTETPSPGQFETYKGTSLKVEVDQFAFYGVHLDVQKKNEVPCQNN